MKTELQNTFTLKLPTWTREFLACNADGKGDYDFRAKEERMRFAIDIARINVENGGGPFGAAVFRLHGKSGAGNSKGTENTEASLLSIGMNLVEINQASIAHAEIVALSLAQKAAANYDLGAGGAFCQLVSSASPCAQCYGAIPWSGVASLLCGASVEDTEKIGFDEGPRAKDWIEQLALRDIAVEEDILRDEAAEILSSYAASGRTIYNAGGE